MRNQLLVVAAACVAIALSVGPSRASSADAKYAVDWSPCPGSDRVQCGTLKVPVDWADQHSTEITLAVARRPADQPARRIGTLFYNPGGPGDTALKYILGADSYFSGVFSAELKARFDIVAMDPRGVGDSTPVHCGVPIVAPGVTLFPKTEAQFRTLKQHSRAVGLSCLRDSGELARHVDTVSVARDHEALRRALHVDRVSWLAISYGAQVAANHAALFPHSIRAVVIDAALEHSGGEIEMSTEGIAITEDAFNRFAAWCDTTTECVLHGQDVAAAFDRLVRDADAHPLQVPGAIRPVSGEDIRIATADGLTLKEPSIYGPDASWAGFSRRLAAALAGDGSGFAIPVGADIASRGANACLDYDLDVHTYAQLQQRMTMAEQLAPHTQGGSELWQIINCIAWPIPVANPLHRLDVRGVPTMIVNATHDPESSYRWAFSLAAQIRGSVVVTRVGDGHTSYYTSGCARAHVDGFLSHSVAPATQVCPN
jgi:pimeloyl-ACP methyl ester carboxylesterase